MHMRIGEFAAFCDVSVRALRIYDRLKLLKPAFTDTETGYRYYTPDQMQRLNAIISYKRMGFSLRTIRELLAPNADPDARVQILREKQRENNKNIQVLQYNNENIQRILDSWQAAQKRESEQERAIRMSRIACLENEKLEHDFSQILWL
jgi:DNA-binding transcriptional MerR regulator